MTLREAGREGGETGREGNRKGTGIGGEERESVEVKRSPYSLHFTAIGDVKGGEK